MRISTTILFLFFLGSSCFAQVKADTSKKEEAFTMVEEMPEYPGGMKSLYEYIAKNVVYPTKERKAGIQGKVFIKFIVEKDGAVSSVEVLRGIVNGKALDDEAVRVVSAMSKWSPGKLNGKPVRVYYNLPINFSLK